MEKILWYSFEGKYVGENNKNTIGDKIYSLEKDLQIWQSTN